MTNLVKRSFIVFVLLFSLNSFAQEGDEKQNPSRAGYDYKGKPFTELTSEEKKILDTILQEYINRSDIVLTEEENRLYSEKIAYLEKVEKSYWDKIKIGIAFGFLGILLLLVALKNLISFFIKNPEKKYQFVLKTDFTYRMLAVFLPVAALTSYAHTFIPLIFPFTFLPPFIVCALYFWFGYNKKKFEKSLTDIRSQPRTCPLCKKEMRLLSKAEEEKYLDEGQILEQKVKSVEYDVWLCSCGKVQIERYTAVFSNEVNKEIPIPKVIQCSKCKYETLKFVSSKTLLAPDYDNPGKIQINRKCANCGEETEVVEPIPRLIRKRSKKIGKV